MQNLQPFQEIMTDRPTDQLTSQSTDRPTYQETDIGGHMDKSSTKLLASLAAQNEKKIRVLRQERYNFNFPALAGNYNGQIDHTANLQTGI